MIRRIKLTFLLLVIIQGFHSIEEYLGKLWEVFVPARFLCSLVSSNLEEGFLIINTGLFIFGVGSFFFMQRNYLRIQVIMWFWIGIETINGIGHPIWALSQKAYVPGLVTAPLLLILALFLAKLLLTNKPPAAPVT